MILTSSKRDGIFIFLKARLRCHFDDSLSITFCAWSVTQIDTRSQSQFQSRPWLLKLNLVSIFTLSVYFDWVYLGPRMWLYFVCVFSDGLFRFDEPLSRMFWGDLWCYFLPAYKFFKFEIFDLFARTIINLGVREK